MIELEVNFYSAESSQIINQKTISHLIKAQDNYIKSKNLTEIAYLENQVINLKKSIESLENSLIEFLNENKDFSLDDASNFINKKYVKNKCLSIFPPKHNLEGMFAARLVKL